MKSLGDGIDEQQKAACGGTRDGIRTRAEKKRSKLEVQKKRKDWK